MATTDGTPQHRKELRQLTNLERLKIKAIARNTSKSVAEYLTTYVRRRAPLSDSEVLRAEYQLGCIVIQNSARAAEDGCRMLTLPKPAKTRRRK